MRSPEDVIAEAINAARLRDDSARVAAAGVLVALRAEFTVRSCNSFGYWSDTTIIPSSSEQTDA